MEPTCHRCGNSVKDGETFCPHCGAPQFVVEPGEPGAQQVPVIRFQSDPHLVRWRAAITSALLVAIPVGLLSALTEMYSLFVIGGGFAVVTLYRRRTAGFTDGKIGWRVGSMLGVASALVATTTYATRMVVARYLLHNGKAIDQLFQQAAQLDVSYLKASAQQGTQTPELTHSLQAITSFVLSPDGHAWMQLMTAAAMSLGMVLFAAVGGAIAGRLLAARARAQRSL